MGNVLVKRGRRLFIIHLANGRGGGGGGEGANSRICGKCICAYNRLDYQQPLILFKVTGAAPRETIAQARAGRKIFSRLAQLPFWLNVGIILRFWETAHLSLPSANILP